MRSLRAFLTQPPAAIEPENHRVFVLLSVGCFSAIIVHLFVTAFFAAVGVREMVLVNLASIPAYALGFYWNRRGGHLAAAVVATVELCLHQILAVHYVGWPVGLQYYLLVLPSVLFSLASAGTLVKSSLVALAVATFLGLMHYSGTHAPAYLLPGTVVLVVNFINLGVVFLLLAFFAHNYAQAAARAEAGLREEYGRAESLLHNILPVPIAQRLKEADDVIADGFGEASVLFADLVGFTELSQRLSPHALVALLNEIFSAFDDRVASRGLEKIKTIGDAYMVAAGLPEPREGHAAALVELAWDLLDIIAALRAERGLDLAMRIGINSGPVVAGVIGKRKFIYDLWGDAVNTAARMESHGLPGEIQVTRATRDLLPADLYDCAPRGEIPIKGKGTMAVFLVQRRVPEEALGDAGGI